MAGDSSAKRALEEALRNGPYSLTPKQAAKFVSNIEIEEHCGCWLWKAGKFSNGYGQSTVTKNKRNHPVGAHRLSYSSVVAKRLLETREYVCHSCDNKACVNPAHLWLGNALSNTRDAGAKGLLCRGEQVNTNKLSPENVFEIRERYATGALQKDLADQFGVFQSNISRITRGATWAHL